MHGLMSGDGKRGYELPRPSSTLLVVFLASHGLSDQAGNYYFVPTDAKEEDLIKLDAAGERGAQSISSKLPSLISWKVYFDALRSVPGKRLLVVDTPAAKGLC